MHFRGPTWFIRTIVTLSVVATVASLILLYLDISGRLTIWSHTAVLWVDTSLCAVMLTEWFVLLALVDRKLAYIKTRWIDLLASLPLLLLMRPFRVVRLVRLLRLLRGVALVWKMLRPWNEALGSSIFKSAAIVIVLVILLAALAITDLERHNPELNQFPDALWWALVTTTTVGYGDAVPVSNEGRFIAGILMILGIGLFGSFAASLTAALTKTRPDVTSRQLMARIDALEERLTATFEQQRWGADAPGDSPPNVRRRAG